MDKQTELLEQMKDRLIASAMAHGVPHNDAALVVMLSLIMLSEAEREFTTKLQENIRNG